MHRIQTLMISVAVVMIVGIGWVVAEEAEDTLCIPMGTITLEAPADVEAQRAEMEFPHSAHFDFNCKECHHTWDGEDPVLSCSTAECHDLTKIPEEGFKSGEGVRYYKSAFHDACIGCHKEIKMRNKKMENSMASLKGELQRTGPTGCNGCHPKE
jgi:hypothetical protein